MYFVIRGLDGIEALVWKNSKLEDILLQAIDSGCLLSRGFRRSSASRSTGPPDIQIESMRDLMWAFGRGNCNGVKRLAKIKP